MLQTAFTGSRTTFLDPVPATRNVTVRKSVYDLTDPEAAALRGAFAKLQAINDNRGYQYIAGIHGLPQYYCPHGNLFFLIWHRPYVLMFEQALQTVADGIALPYWDWASDRAQTDGIPPLFADPTYVDAGTGQPAANPLYKAAISFTNPNNWAETFRDPAAPANLADLAALVQSANREADYNAFCPAVEQPHNGLHGWVGGTMAQVPYAAFDPVFWVHHCFVEKLFCDWQDRTGADLPSSIAGKVQAPFSKTADQLWDYKALGYRYAPPLANTVPSTRPLMLAARPRRQPWSPTSIWRRCRTISNRLPCTLSKRAIQSNRSRCAVFFNETAPNAQTPKRGNPHYAGSLYTFGHGGCTGDPGHCDVPIVPDDAARFTLLRPEHPLTPRRLTLDVTRALRQAKASPTGTRLAVHLVLVDPKGNELPMDALDFEMLTLDAV